MNSTDHIEFDNNSWVSEWSEIGEAFLHYYSGLFLFCIPNFADDFCSIIVVNEQIASNLFLCDVPTMTEIRGHFSA